MRILPLLIPLAAAYRFDYAFSFHGFFDEKIYPDIARVSSFKITKEENFNINVALKTSS